MTFGFCCAASTSCLSSHGPIVEIEITGGRLECWFQTQGLSSHGPVDGMETGREARPGTRALAASQQLWPVCRNGNFVMAILMRELHYCLSDLHPVDGMEAIKLCGLDRHTCQVSSTYTLLPGWKQVSLSFGFHEHVRLRNLYPSDGCGLCTD